MTFTNKYWQILTVLGVAVVLFLSVWKGIAGGRDRARAQEVVENVQQLQMALEYFYNDQNRFPTSEELLNPSLASLYIKNYPPREAVSPTCPQTYQYKRLSFTGYQLNFCLPVSSGIFQQGWNKIIKNK